MHSDVLDEIRSLGLAEEPRKPARATWNPRGTRADLDRRVARVQRAGATVVVKERAPRLDVYVHVILQECPCLDEVWRSVWVLRDFEKPIGVHFEVHTEVHETRGDATSSYLEGM